MQYATKLKAYPSNPAHDCVFNPLYENVYDKQPNTIQPFGLRVNTHFENSVPTLLYHYPLNHQYILQSIQMLPI
jgi:hypothetical protein